MLTSEMFDILAKLSIIFPDLFLVGGCVRDYLLGLQPKDLDFTTPLLPEDVIRIAKLHNLHSIPTGLKHGTVTVLFEGVPYEITTFRKDMDCDGRHAEVEYTDDILTDLKRRDFTINAMAMDKEGKIIDPFNGQYDLKEGLIRTVGNPEDRFKEDYLRIMRMIRFQNKFDFRIVSTTARAALKLVPEVLSKVSPERITQEFEKAFQSPNTGEYIRSMDELGLFTLIFPEYKTAKECTHNPKHHPEGSCFNHLILVMNKATEPNYKWHVLLHDVGKPISATPSPNGDYFRYYGHPHEGAKLIEGIAKRLRWSNDLKESVETTTELHMLPWDLVDSHPSIPMKIRKKLHLKAGKHLEALKYVCKADDGHNEFDTIKEIFEPLPIEETIEPVLRGQDLIELGMVPSKEFGVLLKQAFDIQIDENITDKLVLLKRIGLHV
jgi:tRNA nucleotidyltransferase/poly(A) polymerase